MYVPYMYVLMRQRSYAISRGHRTVTNGADERGRALMQAIRRKLEWCRPLPEEHVRAGEVSSPMAAAHEQRALMQ